MSNNVSQSEDLKGMVKDDGLIAYHTYSEKEKVAFVCHINKIMAESAKAAA